MSGGTARGLRWAVAAAAAWSALCVALDAAGHVPSGPTPLDRWYRIQAGLVWGVVPLQALLADAVARRLAAVPAARGWVSAAFGIGLLVFVAVDAVAWSMVGFDRLGGVLAVSAPLCLLLMTALGARGLMRAGAKGLRATAAVLVGLLTAVIVGGGLLR